MKREFAVVKYIEKELGIWVGVGLGAFMGILLLLHVVVAVGSGGGESIVNGIDIFLYLLLFMSIVLGFRRHIKFIFQNSVTGSALSWGVYIGHVVAGIATLPATLFLGSVIEPLFRLAGINTHGFIALSFISDGVCHWKNLGIALMTGLIVAVLSLLISLINYHLGGWKTFVFWAVVMVLGNLVLSVGWFIFGAALQGAAGEAPGLIVWLAARVKNLLAWLSESYRHQVILAIGFFAVISAIDLLILRRLQLREK